MSKAAAAGKASKLVGGATGAASGIKGKVRLLVSSGEAKPGPSIGQALGPLGLNMAECTFSREEAGGGQATDAASLRS